MLPSCCLLALCLPLGCGVMAIRERAHGGISRVFTPLGGMLGVGWRGLGLIPETARPRVGFLRSAIMRKKNGPKKSTVGHAVGRLCLCVACFYCWGFRGKGRTEHAKNTLKPARRGALENRAKHVGRRPRPCSWPAGWGGGAVTEPSARRPARLGCARAPRVCRAIMRVALRTSPRRTHGRTSHVAFERRFVAVCGSGSVAPVRARAREEFRRAYLNRRNSHQKRSR